MHYLLIYELVDDYLARRDAFRNEHLTLAQSAAKRGELILGGAFDDPADHAILLFAGDGPQTAQAFALADPYVLNGLVRHWSVRKWKTVVGKDAAEAITETRK